MRRASSSRDCRMDANATCSVASSETLEATVRSQSVCRWARFPNTDEPFAAAKLYSQSLCLDAAAMMLVTLSHFASMWHVYRYFRPTDIVLGDLGFTAILLPSAFFRPLPAKGTPSKSKTRHMLGSKCDLKMHVRNLGYTLSLPIEGENPTFSTTSQLNGNFNGLYLHKT